MQKADLLDILLIVVGYILMHMPFIICSSPCALGSNLSIAILSSSILMFTLNLPISHYLQIPLDPISLTEALPFFVCMVGFDKPLSLAAAVPNHPSFVISHYRVDRPTMSQLSQFPLIGAHPSTILPGNLIAI